MSQRARQTFETADGKLFTLAYASLEDWAFYVESLLIGLGCSEEYAAREADRIRQARLPERSTS